MVLSVIAAIAFFFFLLRFTYRHVNTVIRRDLTLWKHINALIVQFYDTENDYACDSNVSYKKKKKKKI